MIDYGRTGYQQTGEYVILLAAVGVVAHVDWSTLSGLVGFRSLVVR